MLVCPISWYSLKCSQHCIWKTHGIFSSGGTTETLGPCCTHLANTFRLYTLRRILLPHSLTWQCLIILQSQWQQPVFYIALTLALLRYLKLAYTRRIQVAGYHCTGRCYSWLLLYWKILFLVIVMLEYIIIFRDKLKRSASKPHSFNTIPVY